MHNASSWPYTPFDLEITKTERKNRKKKKQATTKTRTKEEKEITWLIEEEKEIDHRGGLLVTMLINKDQSITTT